jgi:SAM-dependent methyltransferase
VPMEKTCIMCGSSTLQPTSETFNLAEILHRWEREVPVKFTDVVWQQYTQPRSPQITLHRCSQCGFAVFDPIVGGSSDFYTCITTSDGSSYTEGKWEFRQAVKDLERNECRRVLDIGCGSGYFLDLLRNSLPHVQAIGFDFNSEMADLVRSKGHNVFEGVSPEELLEANEEAFDAVCIFQMLEHVTNPVELLQLSYRLLKANGVLIVAVPDNAGPVQYFNTALTELPPHHLSRWRASTFRAGLPRLGFEVKRIAYEPLPEFLWRDYLPVILDHSSLPKFIVAGLKKNDRLLRALNRLGLKWLYGVRGHSVYVVAKKTGRGPQNLRVDSSQ